MTKRIPFGSIGAAVAAVIALGVAVPVSTICTAGSAHAQGHDWAKVVAAARKEGEVIVWGQSGQARRKFWKEDFEKAYPGIKVDLFQAGSDSQRNNRFLEDKKGGVFKADVFIGGGASAVIRLVPAHDLVPLKPWLRSDILDPRHWKTKEVPWIDFAKKYLLVGDALAYPVAAVNKSVTDLTSYEQLLEPKYDRKIVMPDPRKSGSGFAFTVFLANQPGLGPSYIRKLFAHNRIVFSSDDRDRAEWVDSGRALVGINIRPQEVLALRKVGGTLKIVSDLTVEGHKVGMVIGTDGVAYLPAISPRPHPNATRVYLNWFYSKAGQQAMVNDLDIGSNVAGVDESKVSIYSKERPGVRYLNLMTEKFNNKKGIHALRKLVSDAIASN